MPFYRITVWVKDRQFPMQGIRESPENNIDSYNRHIERMVYTKMGHLSVVDYEVAMLPRGCKAVKDYLRKKGGGNGMKAV